MEIGISSQKILEMGLNMAGFILAGSILLLLQSIFVKKTNNSPVRFPNLATGDSGETMTTAPNTMNDNNINAPRKSPEPKSEFVSLSGSRMKASPGPSSNRSYDNNRSERNRIEVLNLAQNISRRRVANRNNSQKSLEENKI